MRDMQPALLAKKGLALKVMCQTLSPPHGKPYPL